MIQPYDKAGRIIGCAMKVHRALGPGFLESVYERALTIELRKAGMRVELQKLLQVFYEGEVVGDFVADMIVDGEIIVENKAVCALTKAHEVQLVNYLTATRIDDGLLLNSGAERLQYKRKFRTKKRSISDEETE